MAIETDRAGNLPARFHGTTGVVYRGVLAGTLVALAYLVVLAAYLAVTSAEVIDVGRAGYPLVWFVTGAASLAAITAVDTTGPSTGDSDEYASADRGETPRWVVVVGAAYALLLTAVSGLVTLDVTGVGVTVTSGLPGWGPVVVADLWIVSLAVVPFQLVGYAVLGVLFTRALAIRSGSLAAGVVGLFSCAGCVLPVVAAVASAGGVPLSESLGSYRLSTVAFVTAVALLTTVIARGVGTCRR